MPRKAQPTKKMRSVVAAEFNKEQYDNLLTMLAHMILTPEEIAEGFYSRVMEQGRHKITADMLPLAMQFERTLIRTLYAMHEEKIPASRENVLQRLKLEYPDAGERLDRVTMMGTEDRQVTTLAFALGDWMESQRQVIGVREMLRIAEANETNARERYAEMARVFASFAPPSSRSKQRTGVQLREEGDAQMRLIEKLRKEGKTPGPNWPWRGINERVPYMNPGDMCTWLAKSKHGKTQIATILAEYYAYTLGGYDVLYLHLETSAINIDRRNLARIMRIRNVDFQRMEAFSRDEEPWKTRFDKYNAQIAEWQKTRGEIIYDHCPGLTPSDFEMKVATAKAIAESRGRQLCVILDYYQEMDWTEMGASNEVAGYNALATFLKTVAEHEGIYLTVFAQYGMDTDYGQKKGGYYGSKINQRSQIVIRVERGDDTTEDYPVMNEETQTQIEDGLGNPMFYHRKGNIHADSVFNIIQVNEGEIGPVPVRYINAYGIIKNNPTGRTSIPQPSVPTAKK